MNRAQPGGYVGLIGLLILVAIVGFLFSRTDLLSPKPASVSPGTPDGMQGSVQMEQTQTPIDAANAAKARIESNYEEVRTEGG
jgi:hypothetical protein